MRAQSAERPPGWGGPGSSSVWLHLGLRGYAREGLGWLDRLNGAGADDAVVRAAVARMGLMLVVGDVAGMRQEAAVALPLARRVGDQLEDDIGGGGNLGLRGDDAVLDHASIKAGAVGPVEGVQACKWLLRPVHACSGLVDGADEGVEVEPAKAAREDENGSGAGPLTGLLRDLAASGRRAVVCSQGGAIPEAVRALSGVSDVRARKGSLWVLSLDGGVLVDAHYTARLLEPA